MKKNQILVFTDVVFGDIRGMIIDNEPWFVGVDITRALGYENPRDALKKNVDKEDKRFKTLNLDDNTINYPRMRITYAGSENVEISTLARNEKKPKNSGAKRVTMVNESGLYSLIFGSQLPEAKAFKRWVTSEVLPSIRKTGAYVANWNRIREWGKQARLELTDAIKASGENERLHGHAYALYTDLVYKIVFGKTAKQLKRLKRLDTDIELCNSFTDDELKYVSAVESFIAGLLYMGLTYVQIKEMATAYGAKRLEG